VLERLTELNDELNKATNAELTSVLAACKASLIRQQAQWQELQEPAPEDNETQLYKSLTATLSGNIKNADTIANATTQKQQIHKQLGSLNSAIAAKRWGPAKSIHERTAKKISRLESKEKAAYTEKLSRLEEKLKELGDWKEFASEPKLIELCDENVGK